jgi:hypothetical protein
MLRRAGVLVFAGFLAAAGPGGCDQSNAGQPGAGNADAAVDLSVASVATDAALAAAADLAGGDLTPPLSPTAACPVPGMDQLYPGALPPNPYAAGPAVDACINGAHDAIIVLGCPSNADGTPSTCQTKRADIAIALANAGYASWFIPSGAAAHNMYVEAQAISDLLVARGADPGHIVLEPQAMHTDENIYYSTKIMEAHGWTTALVVSEDSGQLIMTALCDSNCCVELGRLTVYDFSLTVAGQAATQKLGHYVRTPWTTPVSMAECQDIEQPLKFMCVNLSSRLSCAYDFKLP